MIEIVGMRHPIFKKEAVDVSPPRWPSYELFEDTVKNTAGAGLRFLAATQIGIDQNWFIATIDEERWLMYINPKMTIDEEQGYTYRQEITPHGKDVFVAKRPKRITLEWEDISGEKNVDIFVKEGAADIHAAMGYLNGKPPWKYDKLENF